MRKSRRKAGRARFPLIWSLVGGATTLGLASVLFPTGHEVRENPILMLTIMAITLFPALTYFNEFLDARSRAQRAHDRYAAALKIADDVKQ